MDYHNIINNLEHVSIIPKSHKLFCYICKNDQYYSIIFYINDKLLKSNEITNATSFIHSVIDEKNKEATIIFIQTNKKYRNKGIAQFLLISLCSYIKHKINTIVLDDMTKNAWKKNNLYTNLGIRYINEYPEPEMIGECKFISEHFNNFKKKYNKDFFIIKNWFE